MHNRIELFLPVDAGTNLSCHAHSVGDESMRIFKPDSVAATRADKAG